MSSTFAKRELEKKKARIKQEKAERRKERKLNKSKGKGLEDMLAYLDEDGNLTSTPPDGSNRKEVDLDAIQLGAAPKPPQNNSDRTGTISSFDDARGYGFITDSEHGENVFVHVNEATEPLRRGDRVHYAWQRGPKGYTALGVKVLK